MYPEIKNIVDSFRSNTIADVRKKMLQPLADYIQNKVDNNEEICINFICTHNSRRSHFAQIWSQTMAYHFDIKNVFCYSGGTEVTAMFPLVAQTLEKQGFQIKAISDGNNPVYALKYSENQHPIVCFSKKHDHDFNPKCKFAAVMTCDQADGNCPFIAGATSRIAITFEDPKIFDNTIQQTEKYEECSLQIATEMFYVFSLINHNHVCK